MLHLFKEIWLVDFEFGQEPGETVLPRCMVAKEFRTGRTICAWETELLSMETPPLPIGKETLFVAYNAASEMGCFLELNWPLPENILDLCFEFKRKTNGRQLSHGKSILGALLYHKLPSMDGDQKTAMRNLALRGGAYTDTEKRDLLEYCAEDVRALELLLPNMLPEIDLPRAIFRGRFCKALARMERPGIPIDVDRLNYLQTHWEPIRRNLIEEVNREYGVFMDGSFRLSLFAKFLERHGIPWPTAESGRLKLDEDTWKHQALIYPLLEPLRQLRKTLSQLRTWTLTVGKDGRNRATFFGFSTKSSRNAPKASEFIFSLPKWTRGLVRPPPNSALIMTDWEAQEIGIVAALSRDPELMNSYSSGDPYIYFARIAGAVPETATKRSHPEIRDLYKTCSLAVLYGQEAPGLARRINRPLAEAQELMRFHRKTFKKCWEWLNGAADYFAVHGYLPTVYDWRIHPGPEVTPRTIRNYVAQANAAEMMRYAACLMTESGLKVLCPIHDAFLVESTLNDADIAAKATANCMARASRAVLGGFELRVETKVLKHPETLLEEKGKTLWAKVFNTPYPSDRHDLVIAH